jgi:hypothetical protein
VGVKEVEDKKQRSLKSLIPRYHCWCAIVSRTLQEPDHIDEIKPHDAT